MKTQSRAHSCRSSRSLLCFPATRSDVTYTALAPAPVIERVLVDACAAPARLAPAPVTEFIAQARAAPSYPQFFYWFGESAIFYNWCGGFHATGYVDQSGPSGAD